MDDFFSNLSKGRNGPKTSAEFDRVKTRGRPQMRRWLDHNFDYVVIDAPPGLGGQIRFLLSITDALIVPCIPDRLSIKGARHLVEQVKTKRYKVPAIGTVWSMHRTNVAAHVKYMAAAKAGDPALVPLPKPFAADIPHAAAIVNLMELGQRPRSFQAKYTTEFARRFQALTDEIIDRVESLKPPVLPDLPQVSAKPSKARRA